MNRSDLLRRGGLLPLVALGQGVYYLITGIWPLLHMRTFTAVTGPKTDLWLVRTAGVLISAIGAALSLAGARRRVTPEMALLANGSALGLTAIDVVYVRKRRIRDIYLLDAAGELALVAGWIAAWLLGRRARG
jgi:hypothetical protein